MSREEAGYFMKTTAVGLVFLLFLCVGILLIGCSTSHTADLRAQILRRVAASTVKVETPEGVGSGTVIATAPGGLGALVLTCAHVLESPTAENVVIKYGPGGDEYSSPATVMAFDQAEDLALLFAPGAEIPPLGVAADEPALYSRLYILAAPSGLAGTAADGILSGKDKQVHLRPGKKVWQITGLTIPGSSGGTITNEHGELVCIPEISAGKLYRIEPMGEIHVPYVEIGFCIPLNYIRTFLKEHAVSELARK